jgi:ubiquinone/menaquinone biosynthesis C-methylase UbiE
MDPFSPRVVGAAYDAVISEYVREFGDDLDRLPLDRAMLDAALAEAPVGPIAVDLGCGPGTVGTYLANRGAVVVAVDLSGGMLDEARRRDPRLVPIGADMVQLPLRSRSIGLVAAYYSIQHVARADVRSAFDEVRRVLAPGGAFLVAAHLGEGDVLMSEFLGHRVETMGGALYSHEEIAGSMTDAGFTIVLDEERDPLSHEYASRRVYLLARRRRRS